MPASANPPLDLYLANPRGFCAGVDRAIEIVKQALEKNGAPVYVRHEIVHNRYVVEELESKGAIFVDELDEVPDDGIVVFSAHGVPKSVPQEARRRRLIYADATCPLVSKVHREVERHHKAGHQVLLVGHAGHPEVEGTMGQLPQGAVLLVEDIEDAAKVEVNDPKRLAFATQTTLSVSDTAEIVAALQSRFPGISGPRNEDICYATTNRQQAVASIAAKVQLFLIVGASNSSNSMRLVEVARRHGCARAELIRSADDIDWTWFDGVRAMGLSAGASAPEILVQGAIDACSQRFDITKCDHVEAEENVYFRVPPIPVRGQSAA